jgi:hypothetical protein
MITRMFSLVFITVLLALTMTACCDRSLYSNSEPYCPDGWNRCCNDQSDPTCSEGGHWTCCNNAACEGTGSPFELAGEVEAVIKAR